MAGLLRMSWLGRKTYRLRISKDDALEMLNDIHLSPLQGEDPNGPHVRVVREATDGSYHLVIWDDGFRETMASAGLRVEEAGSDVQVTVKHDRRLFWHHVVTVAVLAPMAIVGATVMSPYLLALYALFLVWTFSRLRDLRSHEGRLGDLFSLVDSKLRERFPILEGHPYRLTR